MTIISLNSLEFLGKVKEFPKRVVSILSASLLKEHGNEILNNHSMINRMYGIICGFDKPLIKNIPDKEFLQIDQEIFENLHGCSKSDKRVNKIIINNQNVPNLKKINYVNFRCFLKRPQNQQFLDPLKFGMLKL